MLEVACHKLTKSLYSVISLFSIQDLAIDIRNADSIAKNVAPDQHTLIRRRSPTYNNRVGLRMKLQRGWCGRNPRLC